MSVFQLQNVSFAYKTTHVLKDVSLSIGENKLTILLGRNASGKSTLIRILARIITDYSGTILYQNIELKQWKQREYARRVGYLSQAHKTVFPFYVEDVILTGRASYIGFLPDNNDTTIVDEVIELVGITHLRRRRYTELSGGEQQLVLLARVLAQKPKILLLDEPTSHLDYKNQVRFLTLARQLVQNNGLTILCALHDPNLAFLFGDDFLFMSNGGVVRDTVHDPWNSPFLQTMIGEYVVLPYGNKGIVMPGMNS